MDIFVSLAKQSISHFLSRHHLLQLPTDLNFELMSRKAGVFVTLHKRSDKSLRGCIGTFAPTQDNIAQEIIKNSILAAFKDPRFPPLEPEELDDLEIHVDVLSPPEPVTNLEDLDPEKFGLIVTDQHGQAGLLLPDIGVSSVAEQIKICCEKGGISQSAGQLKYQRFSVVRHK